MLQSILAPRPKVLLAIIFLTIIATLLKFALPQASMALYIVKPSITLLIIHLAQQLTKDAHTKLYGTWIVTGLWFSLGGDIVLMFTGFNFFIAGIVFFLLAHLCFMKAFLKAYKWHISHLVIILSLVAYAGILLGNMWPKLAELKIPVSIYCSVIILMVFFAFTTFGNDNFPQKLASTISVAACFFLASDSLLAWNKFMEPIALAPVWILGSYYIAIYLFASSVGIQDDPKGEAF